MTCFAGGSSPSRQADFIAVPVAIVVAEPVVARAAKLRARGIVIVGLALHPHAVSEAQFAVARAFVSQRVPVDARFQNTRVQGAINLALVDCREIGIKTKRATSISEFTHNKI